MRRAQPSNVARRPAKSCVSGFWRNALDTKKAAQESGLFVWEAQALAHGAFFGFEADVFRGGKAPAFELGDFIFAQELAKAA